MINKKNSSFFAHLGNDLPAGLVTFLVAVPLCLGIALASGAPLFAGIIAGIIGGMLVAPLSGSALGVSGPAAGLVVIVVSAIAELGSFEAFLLAVVVAGIIQIIFAFLKAGVIGYYFPSAVIKGMLSAIGIIIILKQIPHAVGYQKVPEGDMGFVQLDGQTTLSELWNMLHYLNPAAITIALISLGILILWEQGFMKKIKIFNIIQGPLVAVIAGIVLNIIFYEIEGFGLSGNQLVGLSVPESLSEFKNLIVLPDFGALSNPRVYVIGLTLALVASLETLLCVEATDKLDPHKRITPTNRELLAQGSGNIVAGFLGGLPITQVIVRSSANIQSGGRTKASAFFHGTLLLFSALVIPNILNLIPLSSLAAILIVVGFKLAKPTLFKEMFKKGKTQFVPYLVTVVGVVFTDLLIGIALGVVVAVVQILWNDFKTPFYFEAKNHFDGNPIEIRLAENVSFLNKAGIMRSLDQIPSGSHVIIDATTTIRIHPDVIEILQNYVEHAKTIDVKVEMKGFTSFDHPDPVMKFGYVVSQNSNKPKTSYLKKVFTK